MGQMVKRENSRKVRLSNIYDMRFITFVTGPIQSAVIMSHASPLSSCQIAPETQNSKLKLKPGGSGISPRRLLKTTVNVNGVPMTIEGLSWLSCPILQYRMSISITNSQFAPEISGKRYKRSICRGYVDNR